MEHIRSFINQTLANDEKAGESFAKFVQQKAQEFIKAAKSPQAPAAPADQNAAPGEPTA